MIDNLQVHEPGFITLNVMAPPPLEIQLDGWSRFRPVEEFSWYSPLLFVGSIDKPLSAGERTITVRDGNGDQELATFTVGDDPEPPPAEDWRTVQTLTRREDADQVLIEGFSGASLTNVTWEGKQAIMYDVPRSGPNGSRCEWQIAPLGVEGQVCAYEWSLWIPSSVDLAALRSIYSLCSQGHGNMKAGFTSGTKIINDTDALAVSVKGGEETSLSGSHRYEYEQDFTFGLLKRDVWQTIRHEVHWHREAGFYRAQVDGGSWGGVYNVPTWPIGNKDGEPTEEIMWRLGFYPQWGEVPASGLTMFTGPFQFQVKE